MRMYYSLLWSVVASVTAQNAVARSVDPVAEVCAPLCSNETTFLMEEDCGKHHGCSDLDLEKDPDAVIACYSPCISASEKCFRLCADNYDDILRKCYDNCSDNENRLDCISHCFNTAFLDTQHGLQIKNDNSTGDTNSRVSGPSEVNRSQTTNAVKTSHPVDIPTVVPTAVDTANPSADIDIGRRLVHKGIVDDTKSHRNKALVSNNVDIFDPKNAVKRDTLLSSLFHDIFDFE